MGRPRRDESVTAVVSVRLSAREQTELAAAIRSAEEKAGLVPGTVSPSAFVRSALFHRIAQGRKS